MNLAITSFTGKYRFLSNFSLAPVWFATQEFPTVEHAYQAAKCADGSQFFVILAAPTPGDAKKLGKLVEMRADWEELKIPTMRDLIRQKFHNPELKQKLLNTNGYELIEGNYWGDTFWGQCPVGNGENHLGRILMEVRKELQNDNEHSSI